jgi:hypothetical protein
MTVKKTILLTIITLFFIPQYNNVFAQKEKILNLQGYDMKSYHFGFILGTGSMLFYSQSDSLNLGEDLYTNGPTFTVGILGNKRLAPHFDLRFVPSLSMSSERYVKKEYFRTIIMILPLEVKFRSKRYYNMAAYMLAGMAYTYDFSSKSKNEDNGNELIQIAKNDILPEVGAGVDIYTEYFKFGIEVKMAYGLMNMNKYNIAPADFKTKIFSLSFTFE